MPKAHRMYRRRVRDIWRWEAWRHRAPGLTERDYQAMCNFASYVSFETIAAYFGCSEAHVEEEVVFTNAFYGFQRRMKVSTWHPGRGDALKTFQQIIRRMDNGEMQGDLVIDVPSYLERRFGPGYATTENIELVERVLEKLVRQLETLGPVTAKDFALVMSILDDRIN